MPGTMHRVHVSNSYSSSDREHDERKHAVGDSPFYYKHKSNRLARACSSSRAGVWARAWIHRVTSNRCRSAAIVIALWLVLVFLVLVRVPLMHSVLRLGGRGHSATDTYSPARRNFDIHPAHPQRPGAQDVLLEHCGGSACSDNPSDAVGATVAIPFFNSGEVIYETLLSVRRQTMAPEEIVILDDNSEEKHRAIVQDACAALASCRVVRSHVSLGVAEARNMLAQRLVKSKYILFLDADDLIEPTFIEKGVWFLESRPDVMAFKGDSVGFEGSEYYWKHGFSNPSEFVHENVQTVTCLLDRQAFVDLGGFSAEFSKHGLEDYEFWVRMMDAGHLGYQIPEPMDWYRRHDTSAKWWRTAENIQASRQCIVDLYPRFMQQGHVPAPVAIQHDTYAPVDLSKFAALRSKYIKDTDCRVLMLVPWFAVGGADNVNLYLLRELSQQHGCHISVVGTVAGHAEYMAEFEAITADVTYLPHLLPEVYYVHYVLAMMESRATNIVYVCNSEMGQYMLPLIRQKYPAVKIVSVDHMVETAWRHGGHVLHSSRMRRYIDQYLVIGNSIANWLVEQGVERDRVEVCFNGAQDHLLDIQRSTALSYLRSQALHLDSKFVIVFPARLAPQKRPLLLIDIAQQLQKQAPDLDFVIMVIGEGGLRDALMNAIQDAGLDSRFMVLGALPHEATILSMAASNVMIQPSENEGMSLSAIEAMAVGTPVVGTRVGEHESLVPPSVSGQTNAVQLVPAEPPEDTVTGTVRGILAVRAAPPNSTLVRSWVREHFTVSQFSRCGAAHILDVSRTPLPVVEPWETSLEHYRVGATLATIG